MFHSHHRFVTVLSCSIGVVSPRQTKNSMEDNLPHLEHHLGCALQLAVTDLAWWARLADNSRASNLPMLACLDFHHSSNPLVISSYALVWVHESSVDDFLRTIEYEYEVYSFSASSMSWSLSSRGSHTTLFNHCTPVVCVANRKDHFAILAVADEHAVEAFSVSLPCFWKTAPIPASPISFILVLEAYV